MQQLQTKPPQRPTFILGRQTPIAACCMAPHGIKNQVRSGPFCREFPLTVRFLSCGEAPTKGTLRAPHLDAAHVELCTRTDTHDAPRQHTYQCDSLGYRMLATLQAAFLQRDQPLVSAK